MKRKLTCIVCPMGCEISVWLNGGKVVSITGNTCRRGEEYAKTECTAPKRMVTTTMRCENGEMVSVKTDRAIPKEQVSECMKIINRTIAPQYISLGDVMIKDVFGCNIVATKNIP